MCSFSICPDIEFSRRSHVAKLVAAAHQHDLLDLRHDARFDAHSHSDVGQRTGWHQYDVAVGSHQGFDDELDGMLAFDGASQLIELRAVESGITVNAFFYRARLDNHWHAHAFVYRNVNIKVLHHIQCITGDFFQGLIATDGGDSEQFDFRMLGCHHDGDGVVVTRVAVEDDFLCHNKLLRLINRFGKHIVNIFALESQLGDTPSFSYPYNGCRTLKGC